MVAFLPIRMTFYKILYVFNFRTLIVGSSSVKAAQVSPNVGIPTDLDNHKSKIFENSKMQFRPEIPDVFIEIRISAGGWFPDFTTFQRNE